MLPQHGIESVEHRELFGGVEARVADVAPDHAPVLLLHVAAVVLPVGPRAREGDALVLAVAQQFVVDELTAVVRVDPQQREGQGLADVPDRGEDVHLGLVAHRARLGRSHSPRR